MANNLQLPAVIKSRSRWASLYPLPNATGETSKRLGNHANSTPPEYPLSGLSTCSGSGAHHTSTGWPSVVCGCRATSLANRCSCDSLCVVTLVTSGPPYWTNQSRRCSKRPHMRQLLVATRADHFRWRGLGAGAKHTRCGNTLTKRTHRRETRSEISMEPRRLELLTPCLPYRCSLDLISLHKWSKAKALNFRAVLRS